MKIFRNTCLVIAAYFLSGGFLLTAQDTFKGDEVGVQTVTPKDQGDAHRMLKLEMDETRIIYQEPLSAKPHWYFYLPDEATSVVQLIIQKRDDQRVFLLKAIGRGKTVGGFTLREWLDESGFEPRSPIDEAHIQQSVKAHPVFILVD